MADGTRAEVPVGRFAPSPTGPLHFGSLVAAVGSYCLARCAGGHWLVRIEDLDTPRVVTGAAEDILRTLERFGLTWDGPVWWQSRRREHYEAALDNLARQGRLFACGCSRKEVLASAPHVGEEGPVYPGTCRHGLPAGRLARAWRLRVPDRMVEFDDPVWGWQRQNLAVEVGDFVLRRADGLFAYQLAVVVDDAASGITQVVRGQDLLASTPRQLFLQQCLGYPAPQYLHLPLALGSDGAKVSKRHGALALEESRDPGVLLSRALRFLGQSVPAELNGAPAPELLAWALSCFRAERIPARSAPAG
jgi:glutamyl-Q tRNA(Asp) synthetase